MKSSGTSTGNINFAALEKAAKEKFVLGEDSIHGPRHWKRVLENGRTLGVRLRSDIELISVFAILHDCCRENEWTDPQHGHRAATVALDLHGKLFQFEETRLERLIYAIEWHNHGRISQDIDISCCWAADRIELRRVGIEPSKRGFCDKTWPVAQEILKEKALIRTKFTIIK